MDGLPEFTHPQLLAGILAITLLSLALGIELLMVALGLRPSALGPGDTASAAPAIAEPMDHDFYDWLYE